MPKYLALRTGSDGDNKLSCNLRELVKIVEPLFFVSKEHHQHKSQKDQ